MKKTLVYFLAIALISCNSTNKKEESAPEKEEPTKKIEVMEFNDTHTFSKPNEARITHLNWNVEVDFDSKKISGIATYDIKTNGNSTEIIFDTKDSLIVSAVKLDNGNPTTFKWGEENQHLGRPLFVSINAFKVNTFC